MNDSVAEIAQLQIEINRLRRMLFGVIERVNDVVTPAVAFGKDITPELHRRLMIAMQTEDDFRSSLETEDGVSFGENYVRGWTLYWRRRALIAEHQKLVGEVRE